MNYPWEKKAWSALFSRFPLFEAEENVQKCALYVSEITRDVFTDLPAQCEESKSS